jgi:hypothetical protein
MVPPGDAPPGDGIERRYPCRAGLWMVQGSVAALC